MHQTSSTLSDMTSVGMQRNCVKKVPFSNFMENIPIKILPIAKARTPSYVGHYRGGVERRGLIKAEELIKELDETDIYDNFPALLPNIMRI